jgi:hypothetical protein
MFWNQGISRKWNIRRGALQILSLGLAALGSNTFDCSAEVVTLRNPTATFSQVNGWNASLVVDGITNDSAGWAVYDFGRGGAFSETAVVETETDIGFASGSLLTFALYHVNHNPQTGLGRFRLSYTTDARDTFADGLNSGGDVTANWNVLTPTAASATDGVVLTIQPDGSVLASGNNPAKTVYTVTAEVAAQGITGFRIEALEDSSLPGSGPGRAANGNFVLTEITVGITPLTPPPNVVLRNPTATFSQVSGWNANLIIDGVTNDFAGWAVYDFGRDGAFAETAVVETETDIGFASGSLLTFALYHVNHNPQHALGRFRLSYTTDSRGSFADGLNSGGDVTANWIVLAPKTASATDGVVLMIQPDGSVLASGDNPVTTVYTITAEVAAQGITGFRIEALEDPSLPDSGPGRYPFNGNFVLTEFTANIVEITVPPVLPVDVVLTNSAATFSQVNGWNANLIIDGITNDSAGWAVYDFGRRGAFSETAVVETATDIGFASGSLLTFALYHVNHNPQSGLGRFRLSYTTDARDTFADGLNSGGDVTANWTVLTPTTASATDGVVLTIQSDGSILASGNNPAKTVYTVTAEVAAQGITGFRIEALEEPSLPDSGPGRSPNGNFVLTELAVTVFALLPVNHAPVAVISSEQLIELKSEYDNPVLLSCNWWNACLLVDGWASSDPEGGELTYMWSLESDPVPFGLGPIVTNCLEVGQHTILLTVTDPAGLQGTDSKTIEVVTAPLAIDLLIEQITESHKSGVLLSRKTKRELIGTLQVALEHAGDEELRATQKALDAFEKKVRAQVANEYPKAGTAWIRWSQAVSQGMENCINPPRKHKDHHGDTIDAASADPKG